MCNVYFVRNTNLFSSVIRRITGSQAYEINKNLLNYLLLRLIASYSCYWFFICGGCPWGKI